MICWSCERAAGTGAMCSYCGAVQPPQPDEDFFAVLGVPRRYQQDLVQAEARFRELSRQVHPDRFARADPQARRASLQRTVQLNEAWKTVKEPVRRAEYLLRLAGYQIGDEARTGGAGSQGKGRAQFPVPPRYPPRCWLKSWNCAKSWPTRGPKATTPECSVWPLPSVAAWPPHCRAWRPSSSAPSGANSTGTKPWRRWPTT